jgi:hypothetical protein
MFILIIRFNMSLDCNMMSFFRYVNKPAMYYYVNYYWRMRGLQIYDHTLSLFTLLLRF